jgi:hypothetical protein
VSGFLPILPPPAFAVGDRVVPNQNVPHGIGCGKYQGSIGKVGTVVEVKSVGMTPYLVEFRHLPEPILFEERELDAE